MSVRGRKGVARYKARNVHFSFASRECIRFCSQRGSAQDFSYCAARDARTRGIEDPVAVCWSSLKSFNRSPTGYHGWRISTITDRYSQLPRVIASDTWYTRATYYRSFDATERLVRCVTVAIKQADTCTTIETRDPTLA